MRMNAGKGLECSWAVAEESSGMEAAAVGLGVGSDAARSERRRIRNNRAGGKDLSETEGTVYAA